jgi:hypothetical protein
MIAAIANRVWWRSVPIPAAPFVEVGAREKISVSAGASEAATVAPVRPLEMVGVWMDECTDDVTDAGNDAWARANNQKLLRQICFYLFVLKTAKMHW